MPMPKHATVVAYLALFVALGGSAYAATGGNFVLGHSNAANQATALKNTGSGPALKLTTGDGATAPLAVSNGTKVAKLNADQVDGLSAAAFQRKIEKIAASTASVETDPAGGIGPWSFSLRCTAVRAIFKITGPGSAGGTHTIATGDNAGNTFISALGDGYTTIADSGQQVSATLYLRSGSTVAEVEILLIADMDTAPKHCDVIGAASLVG
jgi:hypothetical protein